MELKSNKSNVCGGALLVAVFFFGTSLVMAEPGPYISFKGDCSFFQPTGPLDTGFLGSNRRATLAKDYRNTTFGGKVAIGLSAPLEPFRMELECGFLRDMRKERRSAPLSAPIDFNMRINTVMANFYYDMPLDLGFNPYISGGAGFAHVKSLIYKNRDTNNEHCWKLNTNAFAWQAGIGAYKAINKHVAIDLGYRFTTWLLRDKVSTYTSSVDSDRLDMDMKCSMHEFLFGIRYIF
jgi:opacity protein-like surface antigen